MRRLEETRGRDSGARPPTITLEDPATNLQSLVTTASLEVLSRTVTSQWRTPEVWDRLERYGIFPTRQILFHGPPGNGKTMACQRIAAEMGVPLYRVLCEQVVSKWMGETTKNISEMMDWLATQGECVVLLDEVESLFPARGKTGGNIGREVASAMQVYWQRMDRWRRRQLFVLATNRPDDLDSALMSRLEIKLEFGPPTEEQARKVLEYWREALHAYGGYQVTEDLIAYLDAGSSFASFRELWQKIQQGIVQHVTLGGEDKSNGDA